MSGETTGANTCVFWDLDDCPIPDDLDPDSVYKKINSALANEGCGANVEFKAYGANETFPDGYLVDAEISYKRKVTKHVREMLFDMCEWAMVNPKGSNLLLISKVAPDELRVVSPVEEEEMLAASEEEEEEEEMLTASEVEEEKLTATGAVLAERGYNVLIVDNLSRLCPVVLRVPRPSAYLDALKPTFHNLFETSLTKTGVIWDFGDWEIPYGLDLCRAIPNIESALASRGFPGNTSFSFYPGDDRSFPVPVDDGDVGPDFSLIYIRQGCRVEWMLLHCYFWAMDNPVSGAEEEEHRLILVSRILSKEAEYISVLQPLITKGYKVLLVNDVEVPSITSLHPYWVWRSMFHGRYAQLCHHCGEALEEPPEKSQIFKASPEPWTGATTAIFWDLDDLRISDCLYPFDARQNIASALRKKGFLVDWAAFFMYADKLRWPDVTVRIVFQKLGGCYWTFISGYWTILCPILKWSTI